MSEMTPDRLAEIKARVEAATPGPWRSEYSGATGPVVMDDEARTALDHIARCPHFRSHSDAEFIAHARTDIPDLLAEVKRLRALGDRLAATVSLLLYDAHPVYGSTATWHGGIGGQALTPVCCIIDGPPGSEWAQHDLPSDSLREWVAERGMDTQCLDAAKDRERAHLLAMLNPTEGDDRD